MNPYMIIIAGLPGTGKTTTAKKLSLGLEGYVLIEQNEIRREMGMIRMPQKQDEVLRKIDILSAKYLNYSRGVIIESGHRHGFRRQQLYGVASCCEKMVLTLECVCSEKESKKRIIERPKSDGLLSDPKDTRVYDRILSLWEDIENDFKFPGVNHVSYMRFDTEQNIVTINKKVEGMSRFLRKVEKIIKENNYGIT